MGHRTKESAWLVKVMPCAYTADDNGLPDLCPESHPQLRTSLRNHVINIVIQSLEITSNHRLSGSMNETSDWLSNSLFQTGFGWVWVWVCVMCVCVHRHMCMCSCECICGGQKFIYHVFLYHSWPYFGGRILSLTLELTASDRQSSQLSSRNSPASVSKVPWGTLTLLALYQLSSPQYFLMWFI